MKVIEILYEQILNEQRTIPLEAGEILGGRDGIVSIYHFDGGMQSDKMCSYIPNTKRLNETVRSWQLENLSFMGIYHTHFWNVDTLSANDMIYMERIVRNMPLEIG